MRRCRALRLSSRALILACAVVSAVASTTPTNPPKRAGAAVTEAAEDPLVAARAALVERWIALAAWCNDNQLFEERDRTFRQVQVLDPENLDARKGLRQTRAPDGTWRDGPKHDVKNRNPKALLELPKKRAEALQPFSARIVDLARAGEADAAARKALCDQVLALDPEDATVHAFLGDVKDGDQWVMPETARARARRPEIKKLAQAALAGVVEPKNELPRDTDIALEGGWKSAFSTDHVRVLSTGAEDDALKVARTTQAVGDFVKTLLWVDLPYPPGYTIHLLAPGEKAAFLARIAGIEDSERARLSKLEGSGLPRTENVGLWTGQRERTLDAAVRHTLTHLLQKGVGLTPRTGWVWEGLGLYVTRELVGTRLTWFVSADVSDGAAAAAALRAQLLVPDSNWMSSALTLLTGPDAPRLDRVLKRDLEHFETADMLTGYVFAAYLIEARADDAAAFVRRSAAGEEPAAISNALFGLTLDELQGRLVRWLQERH